MIKGNSENLNKFEEAGKMIDDIALYDFHSPKKFNKEKLRNVDDILGYMARYLSSYLTTALRTFTQVTVVEFEETRYARYSDSVNGISVIGIMDLKALSDSLPDSNFLVDLPKPFSYYLIDRMLGGSGEGFDLTREFTDLELQIIRFIFEKIAGYMQDSWDHYIETKADMIDVKTNAYLIQEFSQDDNIVVATMKIESKHITDFFHICLPSLNLEELLSSFVNKHQRQVKLDPLKESLRVEAIETAVFDSKVNVRVVFDQVQLEFSDLINLKVNDILPLDKQNGNEADIYVNDSLWFNGEVGISRNRKAVRVKSKK